MAEAGACTLETAGTDAGSGDVADRDRSATGDDGAARQSLRVTEDRVLIKADREDHAPTQSAAGVYLASSMAAAVGGSDEADSWFVGTIVQVGPLVNHFDIRKFVLRHLIEMEACGHDLCTAEIKALRERVEDLPKDNLEPLAVGHRVTFSWASGQQINVDGEKYIILRAGDVLGVLEE